MVGKEEQGSGVRDTQTWVSRTERTLRRRGYFPSLESSPPAGGISPKKRNRGFAAAAASFFLSDQKETKESPGVGVLRKDLRLTPWSFRNPTPGPPLFTGEPEGCVGSCVRRGNLGKGAYAYSLPFYSINRTTCSYKVQCA